MNSEFKLRVRGAAVAGSWVVLFAALLLIVSWLAYLAALSAQPEWLLRMCGPDLSWATIQNVWFFAIVTLKIVVWIMAFVALWLTLWARQLK
jgi:hypothetical protein